MIICVLCVIVAAILVLPRIKAQIQMNEATSYVESGDYKNAVILFSSLKNKKQSDIEAYCQEYIQSLSENKDYDNIEVFNNLLQTYNILSDSKALELTEYIDYSEAQHLENDGKYTDAYYQYIRLGNYEDSVNRAEGLWESHKDDFYELAVSNYESKEKNNIAFAQSQFEKLGDYKDSTEYLNRIAFITSMRGTYKSKNGDMISIDDFYLSHFVSSLNITNEYELSIGEYLDKLYYIAKATGSNSCDAYIKDSIGNKIQAYKGKVADDGTTLIELDIQNPNHLTYHYISEDENGIKEPAIGMTTEEINNSTWGKPQKINKTSYSWGTTEQWVYSGYRYIYFEDGIVTAIQE